MKYVYAGHECFIGAVEPRLANAGFTRVQDAGSADFAFTFCTSQTELEDVYFGEDGFIQCAEKDTVLIDLSASTPGFARELSAVAQVSDLVFVEAPLLIDNMVSEHVFTDKENLHCFVAGDEKDIARAETLLKCLVSDIHKTGGSGCAQLARAAYTLQIAAQVVSVIEADALYKATATSLCEPGFSVGRVGAVTEQAKHVLDAVSAGNFEGAFTIEMFLAELTSALMCADDVELIMPQAEAAMHLLELVALIGGADKSPAALSLVYADEEVSAEAGLDWTRAEGVYEDGCEDGCGHDHTSDDDFDDFDYSIN